MRTDRTVKTLWMLLILLGLASIALIISDLGMLGEVERRTPQILSFLPESHVFLTWLSRSVFVLTVLTLIAWFVQTRPLLAHKRSPRAVMAAWSLLAVSVLSAVAWIDILDHKLTPGYLKNSIRVEVAIIALAAITAVIIHRTESLKRVALEGRSSPG